MIIARTVTILLLSYVAAVLAQNCGAGEQKCNGQCFNPTTTVCLTDFNGQKSLCPINTQVCNKACFNPTQYHCDNGQLRSGPASNNPATTGNKPATTSNKPATSATANNPPTSNNKPSTGNPPGTTTTCAKESYCPNTLCACSGACYVQGQYSCPWDAVKSKGLLCQPNQQACNGKCYDATRQVCTNGVLSDRSAGNTPATSATTGGNKPATSNNPGNTNPVVNPSPVAGNYPTQTADLRIINSCKETLWFEGRYGGQGAPIPGQSVTSLRALPGSYIDYTVPATGLPGTRFWAKYGCDSNGRNCLIGDQMQYWPSPPGGCPAGGCTPPVDSLFEATWGCKPGSNCANSNPTTWFDTSQVDGWTIPYKLTPLGDTSRCDCNGDQCGFKGVDASHLDVTKCPTTEDVSNNGQFGNIVNNGKTYNTRALDLRIISNGKILGCMSPCKKLNWGAPFGMQQPESSGATMWMCCPTPTPNNCSPANGCITPLACRNGPIEQTKYVDAVHRMAPGVYSYSYDDGVGLHACPAGIVKYTMEFCPTGSAAYPGTP